PLRAVASRSSLGGFALRIGETTLDSQPHFRVSYRSRNPRHLSRRTIMAEEKAPSKVSGWIKALFTSVFGLVSGAALMDLTPLVNNVIKPGKPVPNFAQQASGLTVTFNNRSTGGTHGWWDFGDGSALEPYEPDKDTITHTYPRSGNYNVKL